MIEELIYTSAPKGLKPGSHGFCTVLSTAGMAQTTAERLEALSGYRHAFPLHHPRAALNPINYSHVTIRLAGRPTHVISRVADAGQDYSGRSNKIAHHIALDQTNAQPGGPARLLQNSTVTQAAWDGSVRTFAPRQLPPQPLPASVTLAAWKQLTNDHGWAGWVAEQLLLGSIVHVIFEPGSPNLELVREVIDLIPALQKWDITFSTYFTRLPAGVECRLRFVLHDTPEATALRHDARAKVVDLTQNLPAAVGGRLVATARDGIICNPTAANSPRPTLQATPNILNTAAHTAPPPSPHTPPGTATTPQNSSPLPPELTPDGWPVLSSAPTSPLFTPKLPDSSRRKTDRTARKTLLTVVSLACLLAAAGVLAFYLYTSGGRSDSEFAQARQNLSSTNSQPQAVDASAPKSTSSPTANNHPPTTASPPKSPPSEFSTAIEQPFTATPLPTNPTNRSPEKQLPNTPPTPPQSLQPPVPSTAPASDPFQLIRNRTLYPGENTVLWDWKDQLSPAEELPLLLSEPKQLEIVLWPPYAAGRSDVNEISIRISRANDSPGIWSITAFAQNSEFPAGRIHFEPPPASPTPANPGRLKFAWDATVSPEISSLVRWCPLELKADNKSAFCVVRKPLPLPAINTTQFCQRGFSDAPTLQDPQFFGLGNPQTTNIGVEIRSAASPAQVFAVTPAEETLQIPLTPAGTFHSSTPQDSTPPAALLTLALSVPPNTKSTAMQLKIATELSATLPRTGIRHAEKNASDAPDPLSLFARLQQPSSNLSLEDLQQAHATFATFTDTLNIAADKPEQQAARFFRDAEKFCDELAAKAIPKRIEIISGTEKIIERLITDAMTSKDLSADKQQALIDNLNDRLTAETQKRIAANMLRTEAEQQRLWFRNQREAAISEVLKTRSAILNSSCTITWFIDFPAPEPANDKHRGRVRFMELSVNGTAVPDRSTEAKP